MEHDRAFIGSDSPLEVLSIEHLFSISVSLSSAYAVVIGVVATIPANIDTTTSTTVIAIHLLFIVLCIYNL
jgi:hypothetical protein